VVYADDKGARGRLNLAQRLHQFGADNIILFGAFAWITRRQHQRVETDER
jgi:hypothetical protein